MIAKNFFLITLVLIVCLIIFEVQSKRIAREVSETEKESKNDLRSKRSFGLLDAIGLGQRPGCSDYQVRRCQCDCDFAYDYCHSPQNDAEAACYYVYDSGCC